MLMVEIRDLQRVIENLEIDDVFFAYRGGMKRSL